MFWFDVVSRVYHILVTWNNYQSYKYVYYYLASHLVNSLYFSFIFFPTKQWFSIWRQNWEKKYQDTTNSRILESLSILSCTSTDLSTVDPGVIRSSWPMFPLLWFTVCCRQKYHRFIAMQRIKRFLPQNSATKSTIKELPCWASIHLKLISP